MGWEGGGTESRAWSRSVRAADPGKASLMSPTVPSVHKVFQSPGSGSRGPRYPGVFFKRPLMKQQTQNGYSCF